MELWTDYEGRTIDGTFLLTKLLRPEGRSAFFSTSNGTGVPTVIRLIEAHFDEDEILARWRGVAALELPNALKLEKYGHVVVDDTSVLYAVMEPVDANLDEVVSRQRLTVPETRQLAVSLVTVLEALHSHGYIHEHLEPANVLAVGEVVKLRIDCIREVPEDSARELERKDVHDLAVVLLQALTQQRTLEAAARDLPLPSPFDQIVRKGMSGEWGLAEIAAALEMKAASQDAAPLVEESKAHADVAQTPSSPAVALPPASKPVEEPQDRDSLPRPIDEEIPSSGPGTGRMVAIGLAVILILLLGWHFLHHRPASESSAPQPTSAPPAAVAVESNAAKPPAVSAPVAPATTPSAHNNDDAAGIHGQWRVVAFTYNHQDQAEHKVATILQKHPELRPEVFTPTGHAPYLVIVGGTMNRDQAFALAAKVRNEGLPRDSYAQNYSGKAR
jgi:eukaryotic-like serine/threonine-protein kinase